MPLLSKEELRQVVLQAVRSSGWQALELDASDAHPFRLRLVRAEDALTVRVYIWNLTHGGGPARPADEYRIQVTGVDRFEQEAGGYTLILGWWGEAQVFAAFDPARHLGQLGQSPSIQVRESALRSAYEHGLATHTKGSGEIAVAFRPDLLMYYVQNQHAVHGFGESDREVDLLNAVAADPASVREPDLHSVAPQRRSTLLTIRSLLRDRSFRQRVLEAYQHRCAVCGVQLGLVEAAHIVPVAIESSSDETANGMAFCPNHHRAYDSALITVDDCYRVLVSEARLMSLAAEDLVEGVDAFRSALRPFIWLPAERGLRPRPEFLRIGRQIRGWVGH